MKEKSRSTEIKIVVDAKDNNIDCVATVNVGSIDLDTTIELLQICIDELTKKKKVRITAISLCLKSIMNGYMKNFDENE